jgi:glycosyltransferase involved in cell wall biosynthesis
MPFTAGSGTKLKLYEAMAFGVPVVATPRGVAGVDVAPGSDVLVAEGERFADDVVRLLDEPLLAAAFGAACRRAFHERLSWEQAAYPRLADVFDRLTQSHSG